MKLTVSILRSPFTSPIPTKKYNKETLANVSIKKTKKNGKFRKETYRSHFSMPQIESPEILQEKKMKETSINVSF